MHRNNVEPSENDQNLDLNDFGIFVGTSAQNQGNL